MLLAYIHATQCCWHIHEKKDYYGRPYVEKNRYDKRYTVRGIIIKDKTKRDKKKKSKNRGSPGLEPRRWRVTRGLDKEWSPIIWGVVPRFWGAVPTQRSRKKI